MTEPRTSRPHDTFWGVEWRSKNRLDGEQKRMQWCTEIRLFRTRLEARAFIDEAYGYIRHRPDLRAEPHGWRMPVAVRVVVERLR